MGAVTSAVIAIAGLIVGWITMEIACKPCLDKGREAIDRNLNPNHDPDDDEDHHQINIRSPLIPPSEVSDADADATPNVIKVV